MNLKSLSVMLLAVVVMGASQAYAKGPFATCAKDIERACADVVPGDGRVLSCLYAHTATLSDECHAATHGIGVLLEGFFDRLADASEACSTQLAKLCSEAEEANDKFRCLAARQAELKGDCAESMRTLTGN